MRKPKFDVVITEQSGSGHVYARLATVEERHAKTLELIDYVTGRTTPVVMMTKSLHHRPGTIEAVGHASIVRKGWLAECHKDPNR